MKAATYNPETLNRIRHGACAADLGWDESFYRSVCRQHGIDPMSPLDALKTQRALREVRQTKVADGWKPKRLRPPPAIKTDERAPSLRLSAPGWQMFRAQDEAIRELSVIDGSTFSEAYRKVIDAGLAAIDAERLERK